LKFGKEINITLRCVFAQSHKSFPVFSEFIQPEMKIARHPNQAENGQK